MTMPGLPSADKLARNVYLLLAARMLIIVACTAVPSAGGLALKALFNKLDTLTVAQTNIELSQARMEGDVKALSASNTASNDARDRSVAQLGDRLLYLERQSRR